MLKWLLAGAPSRQTTSVVSTEVVTDDPLALICAHKVDRPFEIYAVSRVNPLFDEKDDKSSCGDRKVRRQQQQQQQHQQEEEQEQQKHKQELQHEHGSPEFPDKSASSGYGSHRYNSSSESGNEEPAEPTILRDDPNTGFDQHAGCVKSVLVAVKGNNPSPRRHNRRPSAAILSTIPEGKVDYCIPRPVWPRQHKFPPDSFVDDALVLYTSVTHDVSDQDSGKSTEHANLTNTSSQDLFSQLSTTIRQDTEVKGNEIPKGIAQNNSKSESKHTNPSSEEALRNLSVTLSHREPLTKMSRALSNSSSSSGGSLRTKPLEDREAARLLLLQRLEESARASRATLMGSSSSSTSSSGFSSSCCSQHEDLSSVPNSVRNAIIYGTPCKLNGTYEKLGTSEVQSEDRIPRFKSSYYPDFTLDMHRAELLMIKIKTAKRRRCWCRLVTSLLGLIFFLMSVMVVSMAVSRGKRIFGPI